MIKQRRSLLAATAALAIASALPLAGCGFHLRGSTPDSRLQFESVYLAASKGTPLERELRGAILAQGSTLAADQKDAPVTLRIVSEAQEKKILTLNAQGQVREFSLTYRLRFEVADKDNRKLLVPEEIALQSYLSYSESQALAKETEERMTYVDLRRDAVNQVMRQLARVKPEALAQSGADAGGQAGSKTGAANTARADDLPVQPPTCAVAKPEDCK